MAEKLAEFEAVLSLNTTDFKKGMEDAQSSFGTFSSKMASVGKGIATGLTAAVGAVATGVTALVTATANGISNLAEYGDEIDKMSQKMGISAEGYQEWDFVMQHCGTSIEGLKSSMKTLATAAQTGSDAFNQLGISQEQIASMSQEELFNATITALQGVTDETQRTYLAGQVLGKGATELGALLNMSAEDTAAMKEQVHELGGVLSNEAVANAATFQDSLQNLQTAISGLSRGALAQFLPSVTNVMDGLTAIFSGDSGGIALINQGITGFVNNLSASIPTLLQMASSIVLTLANAIVANIPQIMQTGTTVILELVNGIISMLPSIAEAAILIIQTVCTGIAENLPTLITTVITVLLEIVQTLLDNLPVLLECVLQIIEGLVQGILEAIPIIIAALPQIIISIIDFLLSAIPQIIECGINLITSLVSALPQIISAIVAAIPQIINGIINAVLSAIPQIIQAGINLLISLIQALPQIIQTIVTAIPEIISGLVNAIANNIPAIIQAGVELLISLVQNLPTIIKEVIKAIPQIITSLVKAIGEGVPKIVDAGLNLVKGLFNGISNAVSWLYGKLKGWVSSVLSYIKGLFGIHSPSKETAVFGKYVAQGLGVGIEDNADAANKASEKLSDNVLGTFENMADEITDIENGIFDDKTIESGVSVARDENIKSSVDLNNANLVSGLSNVFDKFISKNAELVDKLIDAVSIGSNNGISTNNRSVSIKMGDTYLSGVFGEDVVKRVDKIYHDNFGEFIDNVEQYVPVR